MTPEKKVEPAPLVPPFVRFVASAIPMVFDDSLSYYECLAALTKYLQDVVKVINNNAAVTEEYIQLTKDMKEYMDNYFENLDVQEEINNKLDDMVEAGTLQEIITTYIQANVAWTFDTVADMKLATNLVAGSYAQTLGFHSLNDGGGALYKISDSGTADEMQVIAVGDLYATIILPTVLAPEQVGCYGNGTTDDTTAFAKACSISNRVEGKGTYAIGETSLSNVCIKANIKSISNEGITLNDNVEFSGKFISKYPTTGEFASGFNVKGDNVYIHDTEFSALDNRCTIAIDVFNTTSNLKVSKCVFKPDYKIDIMSSGNDLIIEDCIFEAHTDITLSPISEYGNGIKISQNTYDGAYDNNGNNVKIKDNTILEHGDNPIDCYTGATNVFIDGNYIYSPTHTNIEIKADGDNVGEYNHEYVITNNIMYGARNMRIWNHNDSTINNFTIGNNIFHTTEGSCLILEENFDYNITNCIFNGANQTNIYGINLSNTTGSLAHLTLSDCTFDNFLAVISEGTGAVNTEVTLNNVVAKNLAKFARVRSTTVYRVNNSYISCSGTCFVNVEGVVYIANSTIAGTTGFAVISSDTKISLINCILNASDKVFIRSSGSVLFKYAIVACDYSGSGSIGTGSMAITDSVPFSTVS